MIVVGTSALLLTRGRLAWESMQEGGWPMSVLLPAILGILFVQGWYGWRCTQRPHLPSWILLAGPATVLLLGLGGLVLQLYEAQAALTATTVTWHPTLIAVGMSEALNVGVLGAAGAALCSNHAASMLAVRALSRSEKTDLSARVGPALGVAAVALAALVVLALSWPLLRGWPLLLLPATTGALCVALGDQALAASKDEGRGAILMDLTGAALATGAAALLVVMAGRAAAASEGYGALSAKCSDNCLTVEFFAAGWSSSARVLLPSALFALPAFAGVITLWVMTPRASLRNAATHRGTIAAGLALVLFATVPEIQLRQFARDHVALLRSEPIPHDLTLVVEPRAGASLFPIRERIDVGKATIQVSGKPLGTPADLDRDAGCDAIASEVARLSSHRHPLPIAIDAATPFRRWACLLRALERSRMRAGTPPERARVHQLVTEVLPRPEIVLTEPYDALLPMQSTILVGTGNPNAPASSAPVVNVTVTASTTSLTRAGQTIETSGSYAERIAWLAGHLRDREKVAFRVSADAPAEMVVGCLALPDRPFPALDLAPVETVD